MAHVVSPVTLVRCGVANRVEYVIGPERPSRSTDAYAREHHLESHNRRNDPARSNIMLRVKSALAALFVSLSLGLTTLPPADAQTQTGLVNVAIGDISTGDILSNNTVTVVVASNIAANVCGIPVQVGVLSLQLQGQGKFFCQNNQTNRFARLTKASGW
jgi:hypothetical protein